MGFTSVRFPVFLGALLALYYGLPRRLQQWVLLAGSWVFYGWAAPGCLPFLLLSTLLCWLGGLAGRKRPALLLLCLGGVLGIWFGCKVHGRLPLGISFYSFQLAGYLLEVRRGMEPEKHFFRLALFASFFPQLVQGPISSYRALAPRLSSPHSFAAEQVLPGVRRLIWGAFKKLVIADRLAGPTAALMDPQSGLWGLLVLSGIYGVRIYMDFTGGMDMALGVSRMLGIPLEENFRQPLFARSPGEFWQRWHISLGRWMREFVFYPVSVSAPIRKLARFARRKLGKRGKAVPLCLASLLTWCATALWHGLTPNYLIWGLCNWLVLLPHRKKSRDSRACAALEMLGTWTLMNLIRVWDLYPQPMELLRRCGVLTGPIHLGLGPGEGWILVLGSALVLAVEICTAKKASLPKGLERWAVFALFLAVLIFGCYGMGYESEHFIYDRF